MSSSTEGRPIYLPERILALLCRQCGICLQILEPLEIEMGKYIFQPNHEPGIKINLFDYLKIGANAF